MDRQGDVAGAGYFQCLDQAAAVGDDQRLVAEAHEVGGHFQGPAFDTAGIQFGQDLEDFHDRQTSGMASRLAALRRALEATGVRMKSSGNSVRYSNFRRYLRISAPDDMEDGCLATI